MLFRSQDRAQLVEGEGSARERFSCFDCLDSFRWILQEVTVQPRGTEDHPDDLQVNVGCPGRMPFQAPVAKSGDVRLGDLVQICFRCFSQSFQEPFDSFLIPGVGRFRSLRFAGGEPVLAIGPDGGKGKVDPEMFTVEIGEGVADPVTVAFAF